MRLKDALLCCSSAAGFGSVHSVGPVSGSPSRLCWLWGRCDQQLSSLREPETSVGPSLSYVDFGRKYLRVLI